MTIEIFKKAEKILNQIDELKNTIESIKYALKQIEEGIDIDDFFVLFGFDKKKAVHLGKSTQDDNLLLELLQKKMNELYIEFEKL